VTTRRQFLKTTAAAAAAFTVAPYMKTSHSAGKLAIGLADHWVPGANEVMSGLIKEWATKNSVEVAFDIITTEGFKDILTGEAEAAAKDGHDVLSHPAWQVAVHKDSLEPIDDLVGEQTKRYGEFNANAKYLAHLDGAWRAFPTSVQDTSFPVVARIDLWKQHAGIDLQAMFPAKARDKAVQDKIDKEWNYDTFLDAARKLHKAGFPWGNQIGASGDSPTWIGPLFSSFGSVMINAKGEVTVDSPETREVLEYFKKLTEVMPPDVYAWDDGTNNRWIISGKGSAIQNPPSVWAVASRDAPKIGEQLWHFDCPKGPKGRFRGEFSYFWGIWKFAKNKQAGKDLILFLQEKQNGGKLVKASRGYDMTPLPSWKDIPVWNDEGPPKGTLFNYPPQGDETLTIGGAPAPPQIGAKIMNNSTYSTLIAKVTQGGQTIDQAIDWAKDELEGYLRS
jgi:hypothetical protein